MPSADAIKYCPLMDKRITRGRCYEITEVVEGNMSMSTFTENFDNGFDVTIAKSKCKSCKWCDTSID